ncbi:putative Late nodulin [Medicago truncatula]|uniref:Putative Late nodulin n=1 Tax=Medicago truncatula TaxID=3880 RepID=A0A396I7T2_MEDTR|nr:putative Late nodulin [Medicago truncatula]
MQRMEHMTKIQFCVYVLIIFLSLFLVVTCGKVYECYNYIDCPVGCRACYMRCIDGQCIPFIKKLI